MVGPPELNLHPPHSSRRAFRTEGAVDEHPAQRLRMLRPHDPTAVATSHAPSMRSCPTKLSQRRLSIDARIQ